MTQVRMPDGAVVQFPDNMPPEQIKAMIQKKFPGVGRPTSPPPENLGDQSTLAPRQPAPTDFISQVMSGVNEGIAGTLGAPVDLTTGLLNLGTRGYNALTHSDVPMIEHPVGGGETFRGLLSPTIKAESDNSALQMTRRVGQEVGAWSIPGLGTLGKVERPLVTAAQGLGSAIGSGTGAAIAQQVAPGNPLAEFAGQMLGGLTPGGIGRALERKPISKGIPVDELRAATTAAYQKTRDLGVAYKPAAYDNMLADVLTDVQMDHISQTRHAPAYSFIADMVSRRGHPMTLTDLDQLRQEVRRDLITPSYTDPAKAADAHFGQIILDKIDDMIGAAKPADLVSGNPRRAASAILQARSLNTRLRKTEMLQDAVEKAKLQAAKSGSGGNINNAVRQQISAILTNPKKLKSFTAEERAAMESLVKQNRTDDLMRLLGKAAPGNNGLIGVLEVLAALHNPAAAALPIGGMVAKGISDRSTLSKAAKLQQMVSTGSSVPAAIARPAVIPGSVLAAQGVNQIPQSSALITGTGVRYP